MLQLKNCFLDAPLRNKEKTRNTILRIIKIPNTPKTRTAEAIKQFRSQNSNFNPFKAKIPQKTITTLACQLETARPPPLYRLPAPWLRGRNALPSPPAARSRRQRVAGWAFARLQHSRGAGTGTQQLPTGLVTESCGKGAELAHLELNG